MIMPEMMLPSRADQQWLYSGIDHYSRCWDKIHFDNYPHTVEYSYNSRGFRDTEWPSSDQELHSAVWCVGDSFTVGVGSPQAHTWPARLAEITGQRTINVSMDGASNAWISRTVQRIVNTVNPQHLVVMWSYTHRRELDDASLDDEQRRVWHAKCSVAEDWTDFVRCRRSIPSTAVEFSIPGFHHRYIDLDQEWVNLRESSWPKSAPQTVEEFTALPNNIVDKIKQHYPKLDLIKRDLILAQRCHDVVPVPQLDLARDGHHFDLITADWVAARAKSQLNL